jgi:cell division transport system permease protein
MGKVIFFIKEALRALRRSAAPSIAAMVTIVMTILLLGVLIPIFQATQSKAQEIRSQVGLQTYLYDDATPQETQSLQKRIEAIPHVRSVQYISKAEALATLKGRLKDPAMTDQLQSNPLPASFKIAPDNLDYINSIQSALQPPNASGKATPISPIIQETRYSRDEGASIQRVTNALKIILIVITALLLLASALLIANTIRLSIYARRREVEVMRLVGATNWFIRWPFIVEGLAVGFIGGLIAIGVLALGKLTIIDPLSNSFALVHGLSTIKFLPLVITLLACATAVSAIGSGITLRRFLRV